MLDPAALLERLDTALLQGPRDLPPRQRTMRATLDWSHDLLDDDARRLLRLMGVFVGGTTLADLEQVAALAGGPADVVASLESLVEHSLVVAGPTGRLSLLEPVAQYARELLHESGEWEAAARPTPPTTSPSRAPTARATATAARWPRSCGSTSSTPT